MENVTHYPLLVFALTFPAMWLASVAGFWLRRRRRKHTPEKRSEDFDLIVAATLTLLGLIIGFTFSMATSRYDLRKSDEAVEANTIGTEYLRADLLPAGDAARVQVLLVHYLDGRIAFYTADSADERDSLARRTAALQDLLWRAVRAPAVAQPTPMTALVASGMNEVIDSEGFTYAAMLNRIPPAAWALMAAIALSANVLLGYGSQNKRLGGGLALVLPLLVATSFLLIADIDAPRHGLIRVSPANLQVLAQSLHR